MLFVFYAAGVVAVVSTALALTRAQPIHALLYLIVSLLSVALVFFALGAPFVAALEVIVYAGAVMVLFVFVVMLLNPGPEQLAEGRRLLSARVFFGPSLLAALLLALLAYGISGGEVALAQANVPPEPVSRALFGPYALGVELSSLLLTAALVGAYHLGAGRDGEGEGP